MANGVTIIVCGGRTYDDAVFLYDWLDRFRAAEEVIRVVQGCAPGADTIAKAWAEDRGIEVIDVPAEWKDLSHHDAVIFHGRDGDYDARAGFRRNLKMATDYHASYCIAFPGGRGTASMVAIAKDCGIDVLEPQKPDPRQQELPL